jgi:hypothetical protein
VVHAVAEGQAPAGLVPLLTLLVNSIRLPVRVRGG